MTRFKKRINWKGIIAIVLTVAAVLGVCAIFAAVKKNDTKTISSFAFSVGGLDSQGEYEISDDSLYTPEMFACRGLVIEPEFEFDGYFKVYLYNRNKQLISISEELNELYRCSDKLACYARVIIVPTAPSDKENFKIHWYERLFYADKIEMTVFKNQDVKFENLFVADEANIGKVIKGHDGEAITIVEDDEVDYNGTLGYIIADVEDMKQVTFVYEKDHTSQYMAYYFCVDEAGNIIASACQPSGLSEVIIDVPEGATKLYANYAVGNEFAIYQTK